MSVSHSVHRGRESTWASTPRAGTPPRQCMLGYGRQAGGTHPTGLHSCLEMLSMELQLLPDPHPVDLSPVKVFNLDPTLDVFLLRVLCRGRCRCMLYDRSQVVEIA